jgi:hypothetical protein
MKKNLVYILAIVCIASVFVLSCDTKDDPPVPNHETTNINSTSSTSSTASTASSSSTASTNLGSITIDGVTTNFIQTRAGVEPPYFIMVGGNTTDSVSVAIITGDSVPPTSDVTYTVVSGQKFDQSFLLPGEAIIVYADANNEYVTKAGGVISLDVNGTISATATFSNLHFGPSPNPDIGSIDKVISGSLIFR